MSLQDRIIAGNGYNEETNPYLWSSHNWMIRQAGIEMKKAGLDRPTDVRLRGYTASVKVYDRTFVVRFEGDELVPTTKETTKG